MYDLAHETDSAPGPPAGANRDLSSDAATRVDAELGLCVALGRWNPWGAVTVELLAAMSNLGQFP